MSILRFQAISQTILLLQTQIWSPDSLSVNLRWLFQHKKRLAGNQVVDWKLGQNTVFMGLFNNIVP